MMDRKSVAPSNANLQSLPYLTIKLDYKSRDVKRIQWLMQLRNSHPALRTGNLEYYADSNIVSFERWTSNDHVFILANTRNDDQEFQGPCL